MRAPIVISSTAPPNIRHFSKATNELTLDSLIDPLFDDSTLKNLSKKK